MPKLLVLKRLPDLPLQNIMEDIENQGSKSKKIALLKRRKKNHGKYESDEKSESDVERDQVKKPVKVYHPCFLITVVPTIWPRFHLVSK